MQKTVAVNERGLRIGEDHPNAKLTDAEVERGCWMEAPVLQPSEVSEGGVTRRLAEKLGDGSCCGARKKLQVEKGGDMAVCLEDDVRFTSAHTALVFAFRFSVGAYDRPLANRLAEKSTGVGVAPLDMAAQAGMIRAEVCALGWLHEALLTARYAPSVVPCSCRSRCCAGKRPYDEWSSAVDTLARHVMVGSNYPLHRGAVEMYLGGKGTVAQLADKCHLSRNTVGPFVARVRKSLGDEEDKAYAGINARLISAGMIYEAY